MSVVETLGAVFLGVKLLFLLTFDEALVLEWPTQRVSGGEEKGKPGRILKMISGPVEISFQTRALWSIALFASLVIDFKSLVQEKKPEDKSAGNGVSEAEGVRIA